MMRLVKRAGLIGVACFVFVVGSATAAFAHANLVSTAPAQSSHFEVGASPPKASLVFDEAVTATSSSVGVYDGAGKPLSVTPLSSPARTNVEVGLPRLGDGTYVVVWHVVSDDGHPEQGAFTFSVGVGGASTANIDSLLASQSSGRAIGTAFDIDRALAFLASLVLVGGLVFVRWRWPDGLERRDVRLLLLAGAAVALVASLVSIPLQAAYANGTGASAFVDGGLLGDVMKERFGRAAVVRAGLVAALAASILWRRRRRPATSGVPLLTALVGLGVLETFAYAGHGYTGRWPQLGLFTDLTHLGGAALWLGGLVVLALVLRRRPTSSAEANSTASAAGRFSRIALPAIGLVVLSGVVQGWRQVGSWSALLHTTYGRLLIVKVLVVVAIIVVASAAREAVRDRAAPALRGVFAGARPVGQSEDLTTRLSELRQGVWVEGLLAVVVVLVTATLVVTPPAREAAAAASRPAASTLRTDASGQRVNYDVAVQPALPGENTIVVTPHITSVGFLPASLGANVHALNDTTGTNVTFTPLTDGRFVATAQLGSAGEWTLDISDTTPVAATAGTASARFALP
jgi:copper transport protein